MSTKTFISTLNKTKSRWTHKYLCKHDLINQAKMKTQTFNHQFKIVFIKYKYHSYFSSQLKDKHYNILSIIHIFITFYFVHPNKK